MKLGRIVLAFVLALVLVAAVQGPIKVALADSVGTIQVIGQTHSGSLTSRTWVQIDRGGEYLHTTYQDYTSNFQQSYYTNPIGGQAGWFQTGPTPAFGVGHHIGIWTCLSDPATGFNQCVRLDLTTGNCGSCASYSPDGQSWGGGKPRIPVRLVKALDGTQWEIGHHGISPNGLGMQLDQLKGGGPAGLLHPMKGTPGGGTGGCSCPWLYTQVGDHCQLVLPPYLAVPCNS